MLQLPAGWCAMGIMAKVPRSGQVETRRVPPLTHDQASLLSQLFLRDVAAAIARAAESDWSTFRAARGWRVGAALVEAFESAVRTHYFMLHGCL